MNAPINIRSIQDEMADKIQAHVDDMSAVEAFPRELRVKCLKASIAEREVQAANVEAAMDARAAKIDELAEALANLTARQNNDRTRLADHRATIARAHRELADLAEGSGQ